MDWRLRLLLAGALAGLAAAVFLSSRDSDDGLLGRLGVEPENELAPKIH